jgi:hypothetical protein
MRKAILALLVLALATTTASAQGWAEKMFKSGVKHDFGTVPRGAQLAHPFPITNIYKVPMTITQVKSGCGCVTAVATKTVLQPLESTTIEVRMDTRRFTGAKTVGIRVTVGPDFISSAELRVSANSRADIVFNPGQVTFGTVMRGQAPTQVIDVEYAGPLRWEVRDVETRDAPYTVTAQERYRRPGQVGYRLTVTMKEDVKLGALRHDVYLKTNDPASPLVAVLIEANVQAPLSVTPSSFNLGTVRRNSPLVRRVVLRGSRPFRVLSVEGIGKEEGVTLNTPLSPNESVVQTVLFKCQFTSAGEIQRVLKIKTSLQDDPVVVTIDGTVR